MNWETILRLLHTVYAGWRRHDIPSLAAALAFHTSLSLAPLLLFVVALAGALYDREWVQQQIVAQLQELVGDEVAVVLVGILQTTNQTGEVSGNVATVGSILILLFSASAIFRQLQVSLNRVWGVPPGQIQHFTQRRANPLVRYLRSFTMVVVIGVLLLTSLVVNTLLALPNDDLFWFLPILEAVQPVLHWFVLPVIIAILFVATMTILPNAKIPQRAIWVGAAVTTALFMPGEYAIGLYLATTSAGSLYGAAGTLVIVLLWVYYSSLIFLFGAEFARAYADESILRRHAKPEHNAGKPSLSE